MKNPFELSFDCAAELSLRINHKGPRHVCHLGMGRSFCLILTRKRPRTNFALRARVSARLVEMSSERAEDRRHQEISHAKTASALPFRICFAFTENLSRHVAQGKKSATRTKQSIGPFFLDTQNGLLRPLAKGRWESPLAGSFCGTARKRIQ
jgi:hypothetical protein